MAHQSRDYMKYLDDRYGFSPANSQEEMTAAQAISDALLEHDLNPQVEEFSAPRWGKRLYFVPMILLFLGVFLVIFPGVTRIISLVLVIVSTGFLVAGRLGYDVLSGLGPRAESQNVIALHHAVGLAEGERPGRPVVIIAHYDSAREDLLSRRGINAWRSRLVQVTIYTVPVAALLTLILMIPALPFIARLLLWIVALVAATPTLIWGINNLTLLVGPFAAGSVDNKSGVAAMLSVADKVVYGESYHPRKEALENGTLEAWERQQQEKARLAAERAAYEEQQRYEPVPAAEPVAEYQDEPVAAGEPVRDEYEAVEPHEEPADDRYEAQPAGETVVMQAPYDDVVTEEPQQAEAGDEPAPVDEVPAAQDGTPEPLEESLEPAPAEPAYDEPAQELREEPAYDEAPVPAAPAAGASVRHGEDVLRRYAILPQSCEIIYVQPEATAEAAMPNDPKWGSSEFVPSDAAVSNRSVIFDVTDPSMPVTVVDQASAPRDTVSERMDRSARGAAQPARDEDYRASGDGVDINQFDVIDPGASTVMEPVVSNAPREKKPISQFFHKLFHRDQPADATYEPANDDRQGDDWDFDDDSFGFEDRNWKGGATRSSNNNLRIVSDGEAAADEALEPQESAASEPLSEEDARVNAEAEDYASTDDAFVSQGTGVLDLDLPRVENEPQQPVHGAAYDRVDQIFDEEATRITQRVKIADDQPEPEPAAAPEEPEERRNVPRRSVDLRAMTEDAAFPTIGDERVLNQSEFFAEDLGPDVDFELREAITSMGREELLRHNIWFVAAGASELDRAGVRDFIKRHRKELRGAFVINLSCVGAGDLTIITDEGIQPHRRADRRLVRTIVNAAERLHIPIGRTSMWWNDTDAMPAMCSSLRSVTIMGCDPVAVPACSHTQDDVPYSVRRYQIADTAEIVAEVIREA